MWNLSLWIKRSFSKINSQKNGVSKSIVCVIKHANFQLYRVYTLTELFRKADKWRKIYKQTSSTFYTSNMCLQRVKKKKLLGRHNKDISLNTFAK